MNEEMREDLENTSGASEGIASNPQFSDMLNKVLANPQIISAVASALSASKESEAKASQSSSADAPPDASKEIQDKIPDIAKLLKPLLSTNLGADGLQNDSRSCLLRAIKPYVSKERADAIDYMIRFSMLSEILKGMN